MGNNNRVYERDSLIVMAIELFPSISGDPAFKARQEVQHLGIRDGCLRTLSVMISI